VSESIEAVRESLATIERRNPELNAVVTLFDDVEERAARAPAGPLHGVPFTIKDTFDTAGVRTTRGSRLFADHVPMKDAAAVARVCAAGAVPVGKTNTPEFALWWETDNLVFGRTVNPHDHDRTAGGSSGGEAVAVASGMSALGLGSDLGGSIRLPAHYCGVVGFKPTHGLIPLEGHWPETLLDYWHVGTLTRSVRDAELALSALAGPVAAPEPSPRIARNASAFGPVSRETTAVVERAAAALGAEHVDLPWLAELDCNELTLAIYGAESASYLTAVVGDRTDELHPRMRARLALPPPSDADLRAALAEVAELRRRFEGFFSSYDVLVCQTAPTTAHPHDAEELIVDGVSHHPRTTMRATIPFDLTGSPAITVPYATSVEGLPIGVQLASRRLDEGSLLRVAAELERG
jgi:aspartyl-tRNA(Asn)/glutamyl-tRNA(Gln) amidotransferase subunit A